MMFLICKELEGTDYNYIENNQISVLIIISYSKYAVMLWKVMVVKFSLMLYKAVKTFEYKKEITFPKRCHGHGKVVIFFRVISGS